MVNNGGRKQRLDPRTGSCIGPEATRLLWGRGSGFPWGELGWEAAYWATAVTGNFTPGSATRMQYFCDAVRGWEVGLAGAGPGAFGETGIFHRKESNLRMSLFISPFISRVDQTAKHHVSADLCVLCVLCGWDSSAGSYPSVPCEQGLRMSRYLQQPRAVPSPIFQSSSRGGKKYFLLEWIAAGNMR